MLQLPTHSSDKGSVIQRGSCNSNTAGTPIPADLLSPHSQPNLNPFSQFSEFSAQSTSSGLWEFRWLLPVGFKRRRFSCWNATPEGPQAATLWANDSHFSPTNTLELRHLISFAKHCLSYSSCGGKVSLPVASFPVYSHFAAMRRPLLASPNPFRPPR